MNDLYPLKFQPIIKEIIWGGKKLNTILNKKIGNLQKAAESWEISAIQDNISVISNGFLKGNNLEELIEIYMGDLVGDKVYDNYGIEFPLLLKYIDAQDNLSIQVHPDNELAKKRHNAYGKTEMWYVVQADSNSSLISGFSSEVNKKTYLKHFNDKSLKDILNTEPVKQGDVFFIPAGRIHAIGPGILLAEIQQTSDVTYRIYDWERKDKEGKGRELHTDLALDAIDYKHYESYKTPYEKRLNKTENLANCKYFTTNFIQFDKPLEKDYSAIDSFVIYMCVEGSFTLDYNFDNIKIQKGETILIPATLKELQLLPDELSTILEVYIL